MEDDARGRDLSDLREHNLQRVLKALLAKPEGLIQAEIVGATGLSRTTVSALVGDLEPVLIAENLKRDSDRGRPLKSWRLDPKSAYSIGVDIGQTHVSVVVTDPFGEIVAGPLTEDVDNVLGRPHQTLAIATEMVKALTCDDKRISDCSNIAAVTVGLPGVVDAGKGIMADDATRAWEGIDVREEIRKRWPHDTVPERLADNNANLGALAEHRFGAGKDAGSILFIKWSSGIGSGIVLGKELWRGHSGVAGEVGHLHVEVDEAEAETLGLEAERADWVECSRCGQIDCLERLTGGQQVAEAVGLRSFSAVVDAALEGPPAAKAEEARAVLRLAARLIGRAVGPMLTLLDVERVILGGVAGNPALYPLLVEDVTGGMGETALRRALSDASLEIGALGRFAPVRGAAIAGFDAHGESFLLRKATDDRTTKERIAPARAPLAA